MSGFNGPVPPARFLPFLTSAELRDLPGKADLPVLLPIGATEQHGPHLPLLTDSAIAVEVIGRALAALGEEVPALCLPPLWCGKSNEHDGFPGTITLRAETLLALLFDIGESLYRAGFRKLVLANGHGGQPQVLEIAARDLRARHRDFAVFPLSIWAVPHDAEAILPARERAEALHAGQAETSLMLCLLPEWVHFERAVREYPPPCDGMLTPEGRLRFAWLAQDLSESGVIGDPLPATSADGERLLAALVSSWTRLIAEIHRFHMPRER